MKGKILISLLVILLLILSMPIGCKGSEVETTPPSPEVLAEGNFVSPELPRITCYQLKQMMDEDENLVLVDTRFEVSYDLGHLSGAINIPVEPEEAAKAKLQNLPKDRLIVFY